MCPVFVKTNRFPGILSRTFSMVTGSQAPTIMLPPQLSLGGKEGRKLCDTCALGVCGPQSPALPETRPPETEVPVGSHSFTVTIGSGCGTAEGSASKAPDRILHAERFPAHPLPYVSIYSVLRLLRQVFLALQTMALDASGCNTDEAKCPLNTAFQGFCF